MTTSPVASASALRIAAPLPWFIGCRSNFKSGPATPSTKLDGTVRARIIHNDDLFLKRHRAHPGDGLENGVPFVIGRDHYADLQLLFGGCH